MSTEELKDEALREEGRHMGDQPDPYTGAEKQSLIKHMTDKPDHIPPEMEKALFASTHKGLNFTNISKAELHRYFKEWRISRRLYIMTLSEEEYTMKHKLELQELERYHDMMTHNAVEGGLSHLATEETKKLSIDRAQKKRRFWDRGSE